MPQHDSPPPRRPIDPPELSLECARGLALLRRLVTGPAEGRALERIAAELTRLQAVEREHLAGVR